MAGTCPELLHRLERHRDIVIDNNRSMN
jgi:hypothetical protein